MIKYKLTGKVVEVSGIETVGEKNTKKQTVIFKEDDSEPDEFSGKSYPGGYWQFDVIGDDVTRLHLTEDAEKKHCEVALFIRSDAVYKKDSQTEMIYPVNVNLVNIKFSKVKGEPF